ncbi:hypothetical protein [Tabrizicola sp.]|uniref:hypothetical protein n=1 Tax=Tabrizicola sp. TaxID=2005166 RepID=UPI00286A3F3A|nr:hypothetical protein [Tabrizicola sp.]
MPLVRFCPALACPVALVIALAPSLGLAKTYDCELTDGNAPYYIAPTVRVEYDSFGRVVASDAVIRKTGRDTVFGKVDTDNARRITFVWEVQDVKPDPKEPSFRNAHLIVRLTVQKADRSARILVPDAAHNRQNAATGVCTLND